MIINKFIKVRQSNKFCKGIKASPRTSTSKQYFNLNLWTLYSAIDVHV